MRTPRRADGKNRQGDRPRPWPRVARHHPAFAAEDDAPKPERSASRAMRVEALLWLADRPLTDRRLANLAHLQSPEEARRLIEQLRQNYARRGGALDIVAVAGGYRLLTRPEYEPWLSSDPSAGDAADGPRLSDPARETLAVVAYRQPVLRAEVEAIRGVRCGELLRQLLDADLLRIVSRSEELGRPLMYGTTARFLEVFGLGSLDELPSLNQAAAAAEPTRHNASTGAAPAA